MNNNNLVQRHKTCGPSLWRDKRPAIKGLRPPEHHAGHPIRTSEKTPPSRSQAISGMDRPTRSDSYPNPLSLTEFGCNLAFVSVIMKVVLRCYVKRNSGG